MHLPEPNAFQPLAIVGMDAAWGGCDGLDAFEHMLYAGNRHFARIEGGRTTIPTSACEMLLARVARRAVADAGLDPDHLRGERVAVLAACGESVSPAGWAWASQFVDLSAEANPLAAAVSHASRLLSDGAAEMVLFAAGAGPLELPADVPAVENEQAPAFDRSVHGWRFGEGAGAVVWMKAEAARQSSRRIYGCVESVAAVGGSAPAGAVLPSVPVLEDLRGCCLAALEAAGVSAGEIGYVEAFGSGVDALDGIEIAALSQAYRLPEQDLTAALGSVQTNTGYLGAAAGLAGLVRAVLCLHYREIPGAPGWSSPKLPALWRGAPFYVPVESRAWFQKTGGRGRLAALNVIGRGGSVAHFVLSEAAGQPVRPNRALLQGGFHLFALAGDSLEDLISELEDLRQSLLFATGLGSLAAEYYDADNPAAPYALAILGHDHDEVMREIDLALKAVPAAFEKRAEWQTPVGSYFTPQPVGRGGEVALVYPGAFNSYPGVGRDLFRLFPDLHQRGDAITTDMGRVMRERMLYPRSLPALSKDELSALEAKLLADPIAMLVSGTTMAILYTHILQETFGVRPSAAFGYSLGENSMMYATGVWGQGDQASARLEQSQAFRQRLAGPQLAIREFWGIAPGESPQEGPLWSNYLLMAAPEKVQAVLETEPHVYLTHINTPRQVVIGGDPAACKRVVDALRCSVIQAPFDYALHCAPMRSEFDALAELHNWPIEHRPGLRMYSASDYATMNLDQQEVSAKIAHMLTTPLDFPRLVQQVYADGARVFIEAGAGGNCARWVDESLKGQPHLALSLNRRGTDDYTTIVRVLARLYSHRVPLNLSPLYQVQFEEVRL